jgi:selenide,water dikinase
VLSAIPIHTDPRVLVDFRTSDDAGVYEWEGGPALVQTVDFFTPIVDDPHTYGRIAAANALSDVYAMGGRPLTALAIAGFPKDALGADTIQAIFRGGLETLREAGVALLGGHTVQDQEIKFGYAITGAIDPARILRNAGAQPGDVLFLTKPLGTGIIGTAIKFDRAPQPIAEQAIRSMCTLNRSAAEALQSLAPGLVHACTDVTGFGLLGHATEMAVASGLTLIVDLRAVPVFNGVIELARQNRSGGLTSNHDHYSPFIDVPRNADEDALSVLFDPQTSGGLLIAVALNAAEDLTDALTERGVSVSRIGTAMSPIPGIHVRVVDGDR